MKFKKLKIFDLVLIKSDIFSDERGHFRRSYCKDEIKKNCLNFDVKQGNISENFKKFTLRGFHYQKGSQKESKIITPITGEIFNVVIDLRKNSKTYKEFVSITLNDNDRYSLFIPGGCANAFLTLKDNTIIHYYMGDYFNPETYSGIRYNDPFFSIKWPHRPVHISLRDQEFSDFVDE